MTKATKEWMNGCYIRWRNAQPKGKDTVTAFAAYLDVSRNSLNNWMNRGETPGVESADTLASKLGPEIYDLLGLPRPDPLLQLLVSRWGFISDEVREEIAATVARAEARGQIGPGGKGVEVPKRRRKTGN